MMKPEDYEQLTSQIAKSIYTTVEGITPEQVLYGPKGRWVGQSGYEHQIDVIVRGPNDAILVECKYWEDPAHHESVMNALANRVCRIPGVQDTRTYLAVPFPAS